MIHRRGIHIIYVRGKGSISLLNFSQWLIRGRYLTLSPILRDSMCTVVYAKFLRRRPPAMQGIFFVWVIRASLPVERYLTIELGGKQTLFMIKRHRILTQNLEIILTVGRIVFYFYVWRLYLDVFSTDGISNTHFFLWDMQVSRLLIYCRPIKVFKFKILQGELQVLGVFHVSLCRNTFRR